MNPVTFNDAFAQAIATYPDDIGLGAWQRTPLFDYETTFDKESELDPKRHGLWRLMSTPWPFDTFRLALTERDVPFNQDEPDKGKETWRSHYVAHRDAKGELSILTTYRTIKHAQFDPIMCLIETGYDKNGQHVLGTSFHSRGEWIMREQVSNDIMILVYSSMSSLYAFLRDAELPTTHIAEVRPAQLGRSVEWTQARTHYTLIAHGHPANHRGVAERQRVASSSAEELKRMAHDRRGHWRTYRHNRYTYARGSTRWVKQAWCGPTEWMDARGQQIYKILEPAQNFLDTNTLVEEKKGNQ